MGNLSQYKKKLYAAEEFYKTIGKVYCPYFQKEVTFNSDGFHHLRYKVAGAERDKVAQIYKFSLIKQAVEIIKKSGTLQQYRKQFGPVGRKKHVDGSRTMKEMEYFAFEGILGEATSRMRVKLLSEL